MVHSEVAVRTYNDTDLPDIVSLYEANARRHPQFVRDERSLQSLLGYPGVRGDGILVAERAGGIAGMAIVAITSEGDLRQGSIVELQASDRASLDSLIEAASRYCANREVDMIVVVPPPGLEASNAFNSWLPFERTVMMCRPLSILPLLRALLDHKAVSESHAGREVLFASDGEMVRVAITADRVDIEAASRAPDKQDALITLSSRTLLSIATGLVGPRAAYLARSVRVKRLRDVPLALCLLRALRLNMPFFVPLGDSM